MKKIFDRIKNIFAKKSEDNIYYVCVDAKGELLNYCKTEITK